MANNERGAGRKPAISEETLQEIRRRYEAGEKVTALAQAYG
ncbi:MAG: helix-turn-helix domain-containing protein, partial [Acetatifactor sp.]|nr:helix-turn-helix domain-containing protein [Acetatifactor sp.]